MTLGSRLARWQTWVIIVAAITPLMVVVDLALFERNRGLQTELSGRQQILQRAGQLEVLHRELVNAIATLAARGDDAALRGILVEQGLVPNAPPASPAPAPAAGRGR
jgi:hypothetical protein